MKNSQTFYKKDGCFSFNSLSAHNIKQSIKLTFGIKVAKMNTSQR
ncbi:MAG: hypothetical protein WA440_05225 [Ignavibacteriaceae bacterium]